MDDYDSKYYTLRLIDTQFYIFDINRSFFLTKVILSDHSTKNDAINYLLKKQDESKRLLLKKREKLKRLTDNLCEHISILTNGCEGKELIIQGKTKENFWMPSEYQLKDFDFTSVNMDLIKELSYKIIAKKFEEISLKEIENAQTELLKILNIIESVEHQTR